MTTQLSPGPPADPRDRAAAARQYQLIRDELPRLRAAALAWRNGLAGLLAGLVGFGLIKGRTDIGELTGPFSAAAGLLLLAALAAGTTAALLLLRAAHGSPAAVRLRGTGQRSVLAIDHDEAMVALRALRLGLAFSLACLALLCAAVGTTWYGPARQGPSIEVVTPAGAFCGEAVQLTHGRLNLKTSSGQIAVDMNTALGVQAVAVCPGGSP